MSIWNKVLIGLIFVAALAFFYLAARTLKTHQYWRELAGRAERQIEALEDENHKLVEAEDEQRDGMLGIRRLRLLLHNILIGRGRLWRDCQPENPDPQTGQVAVATDPSVPHGIAVGTVLFVFEKADVDQANPGQSGQYLGAFKVTAAADLNPAEPDKKPQVQLEPSMKLSEEELARVAASKGRWTLYEIMPADNHETFADWDEEELKKVLPASTVTEYVKDGEPATLANLEEWGIAGKVVDDEGNEVEGEAEGTYVRQLRDYQVLLKSYHLQRTILVDLIESATRDRDYMVAAAADAARQQQFREQQQQQLEQELDEAKKQRDAVVWLRNTLQQKVAGYQAAVTRLIAENLARAREIAKIQLNAARRIDQRTRNMAQNTTGQTN